MKKVDIMISNGRILTLDEKGTLIEKGSVAIQGDSIVAVGACHDVEKRFEARDTINASKCLVMPGLVNGHTHAAMTCFRGIADDLRLEDWLNNYIFPAEAKNVNKELVYWGTLLACAEMIRSGTTTFCDMYIFEDETARASSKAGVRCLVGEVLFDFPSPNFKSPSEGLEYTEMLIHKWADDPLVNIIVEPHALYTCSEGLLRDAKALADGYNVPCGIHFLETKHERQELTKKFGKNPVQYLHDIGYLDDHLIAFHCVAMDDEDIRLFSEHGCKVIHNPESNMKLASGVAPVPDMLKKGIAVGIGTDGCASNNNLDMFQEMDMAAKIHKAYRLDPTVMDAQTVTMMASSRGAEALGLGRLTGSIKPGMKADIIILDLNKPHLAPMYNEFSHLVYAAKGGDVDTVLINGRIVMKNRILTTIDEEEVMRKVNEIATRIKESIHPA